MKSIIKSIFLFTITTLLLFKNDIAKAQLTSVTLPAWGIFYMENYQTQTIYFCKVPFTMGYLRESRCPVLAAKPGGIDFTDKNDIAHNPNTFSLCFAEQVFNGFKNMGIPVIDNDFRQINVDICLILDQKGEWTNNQAILSSDAQKHFNKVLQLEKEARPTYKIVFVDMRLD